MATAEEHYGVSLTMVNQVNQAWSQAEGGAISSAEILAAAAVHATLALVRKLDEVAGGAAGQPKLVLPGVFGLPNGGRPR